MLATTVQSAPWLGAPLATMKQPNTDRRSAITEVGEVDRSGGGFLERGGSDNRVHDLRRARKREVSAP
jgi:hypothetical protein